MGEKRCSASQTGRGKIAQARALPELQIRTHGAAKSADFRGARKINPFIINGRKKQRPDAGIALLLLSLVQS